tara:strand:+ start:7263 stop:7415 length:153 start_codon:yes stop_codon:yes gene_type:complete
MSCGDFKVSNQLKPKPNSESKMCRFDAFKPEVQVKYARQNQAGVLKSFIA